MCPRLIVQSEAGAFVTEVEVVQINHDWAVVDIGVAWDLGLQVDAVDRSIEEAIHHATERDP